jgi:hypothetical protein
VKFLGLRHAASQGTNFHDSRNADNADDIWPIHDNLGYLPLDETFRIA